MSEQSNSKSEMETLAARIANEIDNSCVVETEKGTMFLYVEAMRIILTGITSATESLRNEVEKLRADSNLTRQATNELMVAIDDLRPKVAAKLDELTAAKARIAELEKALGRSGIPCEDCAHGLKHLICVKHMGHIGPHESREGMTWGFVEPTVTQH